MIRRNSTGFSEIPEDGVSQWYIFCRDTTKIIYFRNDNCQTETRGVSLRCGVFSFLISNCRNGDTAMETLEDLAAWRTQLNEEEEFIMKLLSEIDEQINCLQVEQMELASFERTAEIQTHVDRVPQTESSAEISAKLDLTVPIIKKQHSDEEEEDEDDDL